MLIVRHLGTPNSGFNGCHCMRDPVLYRSMACARCGSRDRFQQPIRFQDVVARYLTILTLDDWQRIITSQSDFKPGSRDRLRARTSAKTWQTEIWLVFSYPANTIKREYWVDESIVLTTFTQIRLPMKWLHGEPWQLSMRLNIVKMTSLNQASDRTKQTEEQQYTKEQYRTIQK